MTGGLQKVDHAALRTNQAFIIDSQGKPRVVNHGVASTEKILGQLEKAEGRIFVSAGHSNERTEVRLASLATD